MVLNLMRKLKKQLRLLSLLSQGARWCAFFLGFCSVLPLVYAKDFLDAVKTKPTTNILPYIEAEGRPSSDSRIIWLASDKVSFTRLEKDTTNFVENTPEGRTHDYEKVYSVVIFDIGSGKTTVYRSGKLVSYDHGVMTIRLKTLYGQRSSSNPEYDFLLKGPLGQEQPVTVSRDAKLLPPPLEKCPTDERPVSTVKRKHVFLKPEHGCLEGPFSFYGAEDGEWVFFGSDGKKHQLNIPRRDGVGRTIWIDWMGTYLLGDSVVKELSNSGDFNSNVNTPNLRLLNPDGRLLVVPINEWSVTKARPTRAGVIAHWGPAGNQGLYIWRNDGIVRVADGGGGDAIEVSPDGCKVAYFADHKPDLFDKKFYVNRLRVLDVCKELGVARDANPFVW